MTDLLPCPHCGGKSITTKWFAVDGSKRPDWWVASCVFGCGKSSEELTEENAIAAWNRRAPTASPAIGLSKAPDDPSRSAQSQPGCDGERAASDTQSLLRLSGFTPFRIVETPDYAEVHAANGDGKHAFCLTTSPSFFEELNAIAEGKS